MRKKLPLRKSNDLFKVSPSILNKLTIYIYINTHTLGSTLKSIAALNFSTSCSRISILWRFLYSCARWIFMYLQYCLCPYVFVHLSYDCLSLLLNPMTYSFHFFIVLGKLVWLRLHFKHGIWCEKEGEKKKRGIVKEWLASRTRALPG